MTEATVWHRLNLPTGEPDSERKDRIAAFCEETGLYLGHGLEVAGDKRASLLYGPWLGGKALISLRWHQNQPWQNDDELLTIRFFFEPAGVGGIVKNVRVPEDEVEKAWEELLDLIEFDFLDRASRVTTVKYHASGGAKFSITEEAIGNE